MLLSTFCILALWCAAQLREHYGDVFTIYLGSQRAVVLCGYRTVKAALVDQAEAFGARADLAVVEKTSKGHGESCCLGTAWKLWDSASCGITVVYCPACARWRTAPVLSPLLGILAVQAGWDSPTRAREIDGKVQGRQGLAGTTELEDWNQKPQHCRVVKPLPKAR